MRSRIPLARGSLSSATTLFLSLVFAGGLVTACNGGEESPGTGTAVSETDDPYLWLEEVDGDRALAWVSEQNEHSLERLQSDPRYEPLREEALALYEASDRIPYGSYFGGQVHNFWQDENSVRGIWRRTSLDSYATANPDWETVLDIDALAEEEGENWVYKGRSCLPPEYRRCLVNLSRGGGDAVVTREFDSQSKSFLEDGFFVPEAKSNVSWIDENTLFVGTDFGEGSLTSSGYPRTVRVWNRGTPLADSRQIAEADSSDVSIGGRVTWRPEGETRFVQRTPQFFKSELF